ncbi:hypothetical protein BUZ41_04825 [Staphylococcus haemolyticus]|uniref:hypothetical protein n=1 Tax=Staphylococcus haemolyticus TaxID=1283 RepID=UPI000D1DE3A7|nr:hypothetical protein [Staphylococcus haemolyticus]PTL04628.1 hypothetical protein BUZ41_04825 [Staphylococcus haemolyticus]
MTVTLSQKSYNALLDDLEKLRKCNIDLEEKLNKEIKLSYEIEGNLYDVSKERDKIINDMAEVKRKAEAFDEILNVDYIVAPDDYAHEITKIVDKYREEQ